MQNHLQIITLALGILALVGCGSKDTVNSEDVNEDRIYRQYTIRQYDDPSKNESLQYTAQFRVGGDTGTTVRLSAPSHIKSNDRVLSLSDGDTQFVNFSGTYYYDRLRSGPIQHRFMWTRRDGQIFENILQTPEKLTVISPTPGEVFKLGQTDFRVIWQFDEVLQPQETITILLEGTGYDGSHFSASAERFGGTEHVFSKNDLKDFRPGSCQITVTRRRIREISNGSVDIGGRAIEERISVPVGVVLQDSRSESMGVQ